MSNEMPVRRVGSEAYAGPDGEDPSRLAHRQPKVYGKDDVERAEQDDLSASHRAVGATRTEGEVPLLGWCVGVDDLWATPARKTGHTTIVPNTNTGGCAQVRDGEERTLIQELGKMTLYLR